MIPLRKVGDFEESEKRFPSKFLLDMLPLTAIVKNRTEIRNIKKK